MVSRYDIEELEHISPVSDTVWVDDLGLIPENGRIINVKLTKKDHRDFDGNCFQTQELMYGYVTKTTRCSKCGK